MHPDLLYASVFLVLAALVLVPSIVAMRPRKAERLARSLGHRGGSRGRRLGERI